MKHHILFTWKIFIEIALHRVLKIRSGEYLIPRYPCKLEELCRANWKRGILNVSVCDDRFSVRTREREREERERLLEKPILWCTESKLRRYGISCGGMWNHSLSSLSPSIFVYSVYIRERDVHHRARKIVEKMKTRMDRCGRKLGRLDGFLETNLLIRNDRTIARS